MAPPRTPRDERLVSIVVPNWNGSEFLGQCLDSVARQTYECTEPIVVDDGSTDGSTEVVAREFPDFRLVRLARRGGFARAANAGIRAARGQIVALLNNDAVAETDWISELVAALDRHPAAGSAASKILLQTEEPCIHSAGDVFVDGGVPANRGAHQLDAGQYDQEELVFGACGGAAAYRRQLLDRVGLFDERFVMYCEDVDLAFRGQAAGYTCVYAPKSVVRHRLGGSAAPELASYLCGRNFIWLLARDVPPGFWQRGWPKMLEAHARILAEAAWHAREPAARARLRGILAGLRTAPRLYQERAMQSACTS